MTERVEPGSLRAWLLATRPATLTVAFVPVLIGSAVAAGAGGFRLGPALAALLGALLIQIGTNLANDVFDYEKGADTEERLGPTRVTQAGLLKPAQVRGAMVLAFALATLCGLYLTAVGGWPIVAVGLASIASGIAYTGGPYPLGYNGLGDVFVFLFFGLVAVAGTAYVQLGVVPLAALFAALPVGSLATAVLVVNNTRDYSTDVKAGKRTLVVRWGRRFGELEYFAMLALSWGVPLAMVLLRLAHPLALASLLTAPWGWSLWLRVVRERGPALNPVLASTAKMLLVYGLLFAPGLALAR